MRIAGLVALVAGLSTTAWSPPRVPDVPATEQVAALIASRVASLYGASSPSWYVSDVSTCVAGAGTSATCVLPDRVDQARRARALGAMSRTLGVPVADGLPTILMLRRTHRHAALREGGDRLCGGRADGPLASIVSLAEMADRDSVVLATVFVANIGRLSGCPAGGQLFHAVARDANGRFELADFTPGMHYELLLEPPRG